MKALAVDQLPNEPSALKSLLIEHDHRLLDREALLTKREQYIVLLEAKLAKYEEERRLERARRFGASSEAGDHQANLFDEAEGHDDHGVVDDGIDEDAIEVTAHSKRRPKRKPLPADLPRVDIHHELDEIDKRCNCCGDEMQVIGEKKSEQLDIIPMQAYVQVHHCATYSCSKCDESIKTASKPAQPIPKSYASPGLLAHVAVAKYADGLPLYRQSKQFARLGIELPRNTLASHMVRAGALIKPLIDALQAHIRGYDIVQMDETPVQVLKEPGKVAQSKSYMWVMKGGGPTQPGIVYHYDPGRSQAVPKKLLEGYSGYLQTDGYAGYNGVLNQDGIIGLGCWAHVRRKFKDAQKALPKKEQNKGNRITQALAFIGKLYQLERAIQDLSSEEKQSRRQADATLTQFKAWLDKQLIPPKTLLGKAISYTLTQWPRLIIYTQDGRLNIDNNLVENAIRPFAIGRKNWLFSDTQQGANASANLYSLIESAKANGLNDYGYLKYIFAELPKAQSNKDIDALLPWNVDRAVIDQQLIKPVNT